MGSRVINRQSYQLTFGNEKKRLVPPFSIKTFRYSLQSDS